MERRGGNRHGGSEQRVPQQRSCTGLVDTRGDRAHGAARGIGRQPDLLATQAPLPGSPHGCLKYWRCRGFPGSHVWGREPDRGKAGPPAASAPGGATGRPPPDPALPDRDQPQADGGIPDRARPQGQDGLPAVRPGGTEKDIGSAGRLAGAIVRDGSDPNATCMQCEIYVRDHCRFGEYGHRNCFYQRHKKQAETNRYDRGPAEGKVD